MSLLREVAKDLQQRMQFGFSSGLPFSPALDVAVPMIPGGAANATVTETKRAMMPIQGETPGVYQATGTTVRIRGFERHPVVQACVRAIVDIAAAIPLVACRQVGVDEFKELPLTSEPQRLVDRPSIFLSRQRLRMFAFTHYLLYGNALWFIERAYPAMDGRPAGPPMGLRIVQPEDVLTVYVNEMGYIVWYIWRDPLGYTHTSPATDLVHFRDISAKSLSFGYPRAASALNDIIGDDEASQHVRQVVTNSGMPTAIMLLEEDVDPADAKMMEASWEEKMIVRGKRGNVSFIGGVKDVKPLGFTLKDLEFPDLRRVAREDICAAFAVDPRMVGIGSASKDGGLSGVQFKEARTRLIQQTIEPMLIAFEAELNLWLAPEFGDVYYKFSPTVLADLVEDHDATSVRVGREVGQGLLTVEEGRVTLKRPAEWKATETLALTSGITVEPVAVAMAPEPEPLPAALPGPDGTVLPKGPTPPVTKVAPWTNVVLTRSMIMAPEIKAAIQGNFDVRATAEESPYRRTALQMFSEERTTVTKLFAVQAAAFEAHSSEDPAPFLATLKRQLRHLYKPGGDVEQRWTDKFHSVIATSVVHGAEHVHSGLRQTRSDPKPRVVADFNLHNPDVQQAIRERAKTLAGHVGKTTGDAITGAMSIGMQNGMSIPELATLIDKTAFGASAGHRSTTIARTESAGALNTGQFLGAKTSGVIAMKEWLDEGDDLVRDTHVEANADGKIPMDQAHSNGLMHPGESGAPADEVINCRCTELYYDE